jgi:hypothetical protein
MTENIIYFIKASRIAIMHDKPKEPTKKEIDACQVVVLAKDEASALRQARLMVDRDYFVVQKADAASMVLESVKAGWHKGEAFHAKIT